MSQIVISDYRYFYFSLWVMILFYLAINVPNNVYSIITGGVESVCGAFYCIYCRNCDNMAKTKETTIQERQIILQLAKEGIKQREIAAIVSRPRSTINTIISLWQPPFV